MNYRLCMHRYNIIFFILSFTFVLSCNNTSQKDDAQSSDTIIPREKMIVILADIQITEAYIDDLRKSGHQTKDTSMAYFKKVFKKHDITPDEFEQSLLFYKKDLENMDELYKNVVTRLNELKAKSEEILIKMKEDSIRQDSLDKIKKTADSLNNPDEDLFIADTINHQADTNNIIP